MMLFFWSLLQSMAIFIAKRALPLTQNAKTQRFITSRNKNELDTALQSTKLAFNQRDAQTGRPLRKIWLHVSSAGELEQAIPPMRKLVEENLASVFLTWFSPSTEPFLKNATFVSGTTAFPIDSKKNHNKIIRELQISDIVLVRYDFWPALFSVSQARRVPIHLLAATQATSRNNLFARIGGLIRLSFFRKIDSIFTSAQLDFEYFNSLSLSADIVHSGDPKWARAKERATNLKQCAPKNAWFLDWAKQMCGARTLVVFGSPHREEHHVAESLLRHNKSVFVIYVPHDCSDLHLKPTVRELETIAPVQLFSALSQESLPQKSDLVVIDRVGFLAEVYSIADIAVVGGGFDGQIHNVLEPAAHPVCTLFGKNFRKAPEARALVEASAAKCFATPNDLGDFVLSAATNPSGQTKKECEQIQTSAGIIFSKISNTNEIIFQHFKKLWG